jgi:hypothetical protein
MTPKHERHLCHLLDVGGKMLRARYPKGAEKYGTYLPDMPDLEGEALEELLDGFVYLVTARDQRKRLEAELARLKDERALAVRKLTEGLSAGNWALISEATMNLVRSGITEAQPAVRF